MTVKPQLVAVAEPVPSGEEKIIRGRLKVTTDAMGLATARGSIAKQTLAPGQRVKKGETVLEISVGSEVKTAPAIEKRQSVAEKAQSQALDFQNNLAKQMAEAQFQLVAAQNRVETAQRTVTETRGIIERLRRGEKIEIEATGAESISESPSKGKAPPVINETRVVEAQSKLLSLTADAEGARRKLKTAEATALAAASQLKKTSDRVDSVDEQFAAGKISADEVEEARTAARLAMAKVTEATEGAFNSRQEVARLELAVAQQQKAVEKAVKEADQPSQKTRKPTLANQQGVKPNSMRSLTLRDATKLVKAALDESKKAAQEAEMLHLGIERYREQAKQSRLRLETTGKKLLEAQQAVMDSVPPPKFVPVVAPADGILTWVGPLAQEVAPGQNVFGISTQKSLAVQFSAPDLAKQVKVGQVVPATMENGGIDSPSSASRSPGAPASGPDLAPLPAICSVRITEIRAATAANRPDILLGSLTMITVGVPPVPTKDGSLVTASVGLAGQPTRTNVPSTALLIHEGKPKIATLIGTLGGERRTFGIQWKTVKVVGQGAVGKVEVTGLTPGSRYVKMAASIPQPPLTESSDSKLITVKISDGS